MAIRWADFPSGQHVIYGTTAAYMLNGIWAELLTTGAAADIDVVADPDPNIGSDGYVLRMNGGLGNTYARWVNPAGAQTTAATAFRLWMARLPDSVNDGEPEWRFHTSANALICYVKVEPDGSIAAYNSSDTLLGQSDLPVLTANAYNHIETKVVRDASAGTIEVRVNGVAKLELDSLALGASDIGQQTLGLNSYPTGPGPYVYWKDVVFWDGDGSEGNDFQGTVSYRYLYTESDEALNWTPSTGSTGWDLLDEAPPNDADYISAADPPPAAYVATLTDLPDDVTSVRALIPIHRSKKTDGGDCNIQASVTPNEGADYFDGADRPMTTAETYWWDVSHLSPDTAAPWTPAEVNAAWFKLNRTL